MGWNDGSPGAREPTHTFPPAAKYRLHAGAAGFVGFLLFAPLFFYALVDIRPWEDPSLDNFAIVAVFAGLAALSVYLLVHAFVKAPANTVHFDEEGLWLEGNPHASAAVRWDDICSFREQPLLQRLDLLGESDRTLISVGYHIEDFDGFARELMDRTQPYRPYPAVVSTHGVRPAVWWFYAVLAGGCLLMWLFTGGHWVYPAIAVFVLAASLLQPVRLRIQPDCIELRYPLHRAVYRKESIDSAAFQSEMKNNSRSLHAALYLQDTAQPVQLDGFATSSLELHEIIEEWLALEIDPAEEP